MKTLLDLFSGIGGFSLAFEAQGFRTIAFSEIDAAASAVLKHWWPDVPNLGSIESITGELCLRPELLNPAPADFLRRMDALMSLRAASLASLRHYSEPGAVLLTSAGSGPKPSEWLACYDPASRSLRTRQLSLLSKPGEPSTELPQRWPRSGMIVGGKLYPLQSLVQDTSVNDCSSLLPTHRASPNEDRQHNPSPSPSQEAGKHGKSLAATVMPTLRANKWGVPDSHGNTEMWNLATPTASDKVRGQEFQSKALSPKELMLPTATAADGERGGRGDLLAIAQERPNKHCKWVQPTLTASMISEGDFVQARFHSSKRPPYSGAKLLPTACTTDGSKRGEVDTQKTLDRGFGLSLTEAVRTELLPTAAARDFKDTPGMAQTAKDGRKRDDQLPRRIYAAGSIAPTGGMSMSPEFRSWFMGFPPNWLKPIADVPGMLSSRRSSSRSPAPSPKPSKPNQPF